jgi:hypothetical protein
MRDVHARHRPRLKVKQAIMRDIAKWVTRNLNALTGSQLVRSIINTRIQEHAQVLNLQIDSDNKTIHAEVQIKGQSTPVRIEVLGYTITEEAGKTKLNWSEIRVAAGSADLPPGLKDKLEFVL